MLPYRGPESIPREGAMGVAASQTVEDGEPRERSDWTIHDEGTPVEYLRIALPARLPPELVTRRTRLVIRVYQATDVITAVWETLRFEG